MGGADGGGAGRGGGGDVLSESEWVGGWAGQGEGGGGMRLFGMSE